jgi:uncharacterized protein YajQ (UPF0234 family)
MTIKQLLDIANAEYPDEFLTEYYDEEGRFDNTVSGHSLGKFIVHELIETFDAELSSEVQLEEAIRVMNRGIDDIQAVINTLTSALAERREAQ